ncbi:MAG: hypothetical protein O3C57_02630 [Verrucomicrobia bacterium]|nr:hypothetical protein [Verrucomicrobiota bacterium]
MKISVREMVLLFLTLSVGLFGGTAMVARPKLEAWKTLRQEQQAALLEIEQSKRLIAQGATWEQRFTSLKDKLPQYADDQKMDIFWMSAMDDLASDNALTISKRQTKSEIREGDVYEFPITVLEWEGTLDAIVGFLFDLQSGGAMLDIQEIVMKPNNDKVLRGRFLLHCAYTRAAPLKTSDAEVRGSGSEGIPGS